MTGAGGRSSKGGPQRLWRVAVALLLAMACGVPTDAEPRPIPDDRVPFDLLNPNP